MNLPFLLSSLPLLNPAEPPPLTPADFLSSCRDHLSEPILAAVTALIENRPNPHPFVVNWRNTDTLLRNAIARRRAARHKRDASPWLQDSSGSDLRIEQGVATAFELANPLDRERSLLNLRWQLLEEAAGTQPLAVEALLAYAVKLTLATHWSTLDPSTGRSRFDLLSTP